MAGLLLIFAIFVWLILDAVITGFVVSLVPSNVAKILVGSLIFLTLLFLPIVDEIIGERQFERLCSENSNILVDQVTAKGRAVYLAKTSDTEVAGLWLRVVRKSWRFLDTKTGEPVVSYDTHMVEGGRIIRMLGISEGGVPLTFKSTCEPGGVVDPVKLLKELGITQIQRSALMKGN